MKSDLIVTKFAVPSIGVKAIERRRLLVSIGDVAPTSLTVVSAPAGFGKTTFMGQLFLSLGEKGLHTAWLSLDADEAGLRQFLRYFVRALASTPGSALNEIEQLVTSQPQIDRQLVVSRLVNQLASLDCRVALFLDDFHLAESEKVCEFLDLLLAKRPDNFALIVSSRSAPRLAVSRLRLAGQLQEIGIDALRFDRAEIGEFLSDARGIVLTDSERLSLERESEGWPAGVEMAAISLKSATPLGEMALNPAAGASRDVAQYIEANVLRPLPAEVRDFLLGTSILRRFKAELCDELLASSSSRRTIEYLENRNLFVVPLDRNGGWYRYHHMFREYLLAELHRQRPNAYAELTLAANRWFAGQELFEEAVQYALDGRHFDAAAEQIVERANKLLNLGQMPLLADWIRKFPDEERVRYPRLLIYLGWALIHMYEPDAAERTVIRAETVIDMLVSMQQLDADDAARMRWVIGVIRSGVAIARDDADGTWRLSKKLIVPGEQLEGFAAGALYNLHGYGCYAKGHSQQAARYLDKSAETHRRRDSWFGYGYAQCFRGLLERSRARLRDAHAYFAEAERVGEQRIGPESTVASAAIAHRSAIEFEWGQREGLREQVSGKFDLLIQCGHPDGPAAVIGVLARLALTQGDYSQAIEHLKRGAAVFSDRRLPRLLLQIEYLYSRVLIDSGELMTAINRASHLGVALDDPRPAGMQDWDRQQYQRCRIQARLLFALGRYVDALNCIGWLAAMADQAGRRHRLLEMRMLQALSLAQLGRHDQARRRLGDALRIGRIGGYLYSFVSEGAAMRNLLKAFSKDLAEVEALGEGGGIYLDQLLRAFAVSRSEAGAPAPGLAGNSAEYVLYEPLSRREQEVLQLIVAGKSNPDISGELSISLNTVKWHVKNIFEKLGVSSRTTAAVAAKSLGIKAISAPTRPGGF